MRAERETAAAPSPASEAIGEIELHEKDEPLEVGRLIGSYRIVRLIGEGGIGRVYEAEHTRLQRRVALKILRQPYVRNRTVLRRFFDEARSANRISHPNIVQVTDLVEDPEVGCHLILELLHGADLGRLLSYEHSIGIARALAILRQVASALAAAHRADIVHRDLKPENIFLTGPNETVKLLDFGVAKLLDPHRTGERTMSHTAAGTVVGTPAYMSPEQALGHEIDHRTDIYAFGIIAYEMLTGQLPISGDTFGELVLNHTMQIPTRPSRLPSTPHGLPSRLEKLILCCLAKKAEERPQSMEEVEAELDAIVELRPARRKRDWTRAAAKVISLAAFLVMVGASGAALWQARAAPLATARVEESIDAITEEPIAETPSEDSIEEPIDAPRIEHTEPIAAAAQPDAIEMIEARIASFPDGANVFREGETMPIGVTPLLIRLPRGDEAIAVVVRKAGYRTTRRELVMNDDQTVVVTLSPRSDREEAPSEAVEERVETPMPTPLMRTSILDPFGDED